MKAAALVGLGLLLSPVLARAQQASGSIDMGSSRCGVTLSQASPESCSDRIDVSLAIGSDAVGRRGAIFIALLPLSPSGGPLSNDGGYATQSGWTVSPIPTPYAVGVLPQSWARSLLVPGGICRAAAEHGVAGPVSLGLFAGYGVVPPQSSESSSGFTRKRAEAVQEAEASGDPNVIAYVKRMIAMPASDQLDGERAAASMLQAKTVWKLSEVNCHG